MIIQNEFCNGSCCCLQVSYRIFLLGGEELMVKVVVVRLLMRVCHLGDLRIFRSSQIASDAIWDNISL